MSSIPTLEQHLHGPGPKRILSLDGGGVRGMVSIAFLEEIETLLKERSGREDFRLSDYFDLIGGTSVGAILATMVALGYSVAEIKDVFSQWTPKIFRRPLLGVPYLTPRFSSRGLKKRCRALLGDITLDSENLKTGLAVVCKRVDTGSPWILTNNPKGSFWQDPEDHSYMGNRHYRLADIVRASAAAPYYFAPKRIRIAKDQVGLFVDGAVSPFNNPSLLLLMLAGIKGYGFNWPLGPDQLMIVSVGTGSFRSGYRPSIVQRNISALFAANALAGLISDSETLTLTLLQWLSEPRRAWPINSEIGSMDGELLGSTMGGDAKAFLSFIRYDTPLEKAWLEEHCPEVLKEGPAAPEVLAGLQQLDRPDLADDLYKLGTLAAKRQVAGDDFPSQFSIEP